VEYPAEVEGQLEADATLAALAQKLHLRTMCAAGGKAESGDWVYGNNLQFPPHTAQPDEDANEWPPTPNAEACALDFEALPRDTKTATLNFGIRYAAPAKDGAGPIREDISKQADFTLGRITKVKTFTVAPAGQPVRHVAILARCTRVDGRPDAEVYVGQIEEAAKPPPATK
jgi:hypothetical protein